MNTLLPGMGSHQSARSQKDEWLTPPEIIEALGPFDLDPCAPVIAPWETAAHNFTIEDDGLNKTWRDFGKVWLNPPYGSETAKWLERLAQHGNGIALIFARTETDCWIREVWGKASGVLFIHGRLYFHHADGKRADANAGAPSALIAYGRNNVETLRHCGIKGSLVETWRRERGFAALQAELKPPI